MARHRNVRSHEEWVELLQGAMEELGRPATCLELSEFLGEEDPERLRHHLVKMRERGMVGSGLARRKGRGGSGATVTTWAPMTVWAGERKDDQS
jgi:hypothetical protein